MKLQFEELEKNNIMDGRSVYWWVSDKGSKLERNLMLLKMKSSLRSKILREHGDEHRKESSSFFYNYINIPTHPTTGPPTAAPGVGLLKGHPSQDYSPTNLFSSNLFNPMVLIESYTNWGIPWGLKKFYAWARKGLTWLPQINKHAKIPVKWIYA